MTVTTTFGITECIGCGESFLQANKFQKRCRKNCGRSKNSQHGARTKKRAANVRKFIGIDGEGVTRPNGEHIYDMLSVGSETLTSPDGTQLHYRDIFEFLYDQFKANPDAIFVGFFLGYDFNQWFRTLPENRAGMLLTKAGRIVRQRKAHTYLGPFPVDDGEWEFDILGMKRFKLRPFGSESEDAWMYINDTGSYFQTSFLNVIDPAEWDTPIVSQSEFTTISKGKSERNVRLTLAGQLKKRAETALYNTLENEVLARVMERLNSGFTSIGVRLKKDQWYGPGQAAQCWMRNEGIPTNEEVLASIPEWAWEAAQESFYGGWFEVFVHGHIPGFSNEYDLNSAYPYIIAELPCILHGKWERGSDRDSLVSLSTKTEFLLIDAEVHGSDPVCGAMLHRTKDHKICRPHNTRGWYWGHELNAAIKAGIVDRVNIHQWIRYTPCDCPPVYGDKMRKLYEMRLRVGKNSPEGKTYKLIYNCAYGKHAQSIGKPKFANPIYASLITAGCRTMILDAIATHPTKTESLLMVATDGVYFREPHPHLDINPEELGKWDAKEKKNLTLFMPGIYWDDSTRERLAMGESPKLKSRGISGKDLAKRIGELDLLFQRDKFAKSKIRNESIVDYEDWPKLEVPIDFNMVSCVQALTRNKWKLAGTISRDDKKDISANPVTKRIPMGFIDGDIIRSKPYPYSDKLETTPYDKTFGKPDEMGMSPDGPLEKLFYDMLHPEDIPIGE